MQLRFVGQPFAEHLSLLDFIEQARANNFDELKIAVAWAKKSGLGRIWDTLTEFREQGGKVTLVVGVSEGGATKEGLQLALDIANESYVFHDPQRTFHPKVYFASSSGKRSLMVGSSNMTAGGLGWNYEASVWVDWDAGEGEDVTDEVVAWFDKIIAAPESCSPLTSDLISKLEQSKDIILGSETRARSRKSAAPTAAPEDNDSTFVGTISGLFKPIAEGLRRLPKLSAALAQAVVPSMPGTKTPPKTSTVKSIADANEPALAGPAPLDFGNVQRRWYRPLDHTAAQQAKKPDSHLTNNLRLTRSKADIDPKTYFRHDFFGGLPWAAAEKKPLTEEEVLVTFRTWIDGQDYGLQELRVSHNLGRVSNQNNIPTILQWGPLSPVMRETNFIGMYISLERTFGGHFNLVISEEPRGDYQL
ncbi:phospholipase D-like domain-containing protein [Zhihengliuella sp. ISTPL4]|uniref:phospholipase D-like domain-containing protein n=1 Tax=Zhihengliuella sp. ISTPL4 TaxID=2058657 RepID=UPI000C7E30D7|nr:phospholipase D family protein [Zhihengliuella sp. ISTPL4]